MAIKLGPLKLEEDGMPDTDAMLESHGLPEVEAPPMPPVKPPKGGAPIDNGPVPVPKKVGLIDPDPKPIPPNSNVEQELAVLYKLATAHTTQLADLHQSMAAMAGLNAGLAKDIATLKDEKFQMETVIVDLQGTIESLKESLEIAHGNIEQMAHAMNNHANAASQNLTALNLFYNAIKSQVNSGQMPVAPLTNPIQFAKKSS